MQYLNLRLLSFIPLLLLILLSLETAVSKAETGAQQNDSPSVDITPQAIPLLQFSGAIGPAIGEYLSEEIDHANRLPRDQRPPLIMIVLDTPGGLVTSLRSINQAILASEIPIACLVAPPGARAMSAGTYMLYACHIAAMAPATTLGAATPVQLGMPSSPQDSGPGSGAKERGSSGKASQKPGAQEDDTGESAPQAPPRDNQDAMAHKVLNDAVAYIRSLAKLRNRNVEFAEKAVIDAATLTSDEALAQNVIELIAADPEELVAKLDGFNLVIDGETQSLSLAGAKLVPHQQSWRNRVIATITDPNIAYILMLIGIYGLLLEFYSPGIGVAGVTGGIALLVALYAFQLLPVNYAGLGLILLGIALIIAESMVPSFGILGLGGIAAFALGSLFLIDAQAGDLAISLPLIAAVTVTASGFSLWVLSSLWKARKAANVSGDDLLIGASARVVKGFEKYGLVTLGGECWQARSDTQTQTGETVLVLGRDKLTLIVTPKATQPDSDNP
ncbi:nodulation protein NfeD [Shewanella sp. Isolate8]|uniref:NfeD family protein n=1 Tax=Shewanella sp. Isolate8 TaxID=2908529 RepID=UPI001EFD5812|nr:nodulation protein NfeD [Shewanella sp. Isolate8]MCG9746304.1 nodulation protein NfeD [Shewanella sp. Isolate8]